MKLNKGESRDLLNEVNPYLEGTAMSDNHADIVTAPLPFYPGYRLLEITDRSNNPTRKRFVIYKPDHIVAMDYTNTPLYALNKSCPIALSQENVIGYAQFFFNFVHGKHGKFQVVESVDEINWKEEPPPNARRSLAQMIKPMNIERFEEDGTYVLSANIIFKNALFQCNITAKQNGIVRLSQEKVLVQDLPLLDDILNL